MASTDLQTLGLALHKNQITAYCDIATIAVLIYDYLLTLNLEVKFVWPAPLNLGKLLYFLTRYCVFIDSIILAYFHVAGGQPVSTRTCYLLYEISGWFIFWGGCLAEIVLIFRTWAIWGKSRKVSLGLFVLFVSAVGPLVYVTKVGLTAVEVAESPLPHVQSCFVIGDKDVIIVCDFIVILAFESVVLALTLIKGFQHYRHSRSSLVSTLYKDGILYYLYLMGLSVTNVFIVVFLEQNTGTSLVLMQRVFHSIFTGRMLLHLRGAVVRDVRGASTGVVTVDITTMLFDRSRRTEISTGFIGAETWFHDTEHTSTSSGEGELA